MAVFQIESGTATGRGFSGVDPDGYLAKFLSWVKRPAVDGSSQTFTADAGTDICTASTHGYVDGDEVRLTTTGTLPDGLSLATSYYVIYGDADTFQLAETYADAIAGTEVNIIDTGSGTHSVYALGGGAGWYIHDDQSALGTNPYIIVTDTASPAVNDYNTSPSGNAPKFIRVMLTTSEAGYIRCAGYMWWNNSTHTGYGLWNQRRLATLDSADFAYDFRGGAECMIIQTRIGSSWETYATDDFVGDTNLLEAATKVGTLQSGISAGSSVVLQLDTGEAANFTEGKYYYLYDFDDHTWATYTRCSGVDTGADQITVVTAGYDFPAGAVISSYAHRYYNVGEVENLEAFYNQYRSTIPFYSDVGTGVFYNQSGVIYGACSITYAEGYIARLDPDDESYYAVQRPGIFEYYRENNGAGSTTACNRGYGVTKNLYVTSTTNMTPALDGKIIGGENWLYFRTTSDLFTAPPSTVAVLFRDTEATS
jgi:hypothetical protein